MMTNIQFKEMLEKRLGELLGRLKLETCVRRKRLLQETYKTNEAMLAQLVNEKK